MKVLKYSCLLLLCLSFSSWLGAQVRYEIQGSVLQYVGHSAIDGASVSLSGKRGGTLSDSNGKWKLQLNAGSYQLIAQFMGYAPDTIQVEVPAQVSNLVFYLRQDTVALPAARISAEQRTWNLTRLDPGQIKVHADELAKIPSLLGEKDPLASLRSLPGMQSVGEATGYYYVRGGGADHNLIMIDNAIIYHPAHLVGLFSVINPYVIQSIDFYKGGIPANYGNRLASVIDIETKEPALEKWTGELSMGLVASKIGLEGPLIMDTLSMLLAFRRTHLDLIYPLLLNKSNPFHGSGYAFYDFNGKLSWRVNQHNRIQLAAYSGADRFDLEDAELDLSDRMTWGNQTISLSAESELSSRLTLHSVAAYSGYGLTFSQDYRNYFIGLNAGLDNYRILEELEIQLSDNLRIKSGFEGNQYRFNPYQVTAKTGTSYMYFGDSIPYRARDLAAYADFKWHLSDKLTLQAGLRCVYYEHRSPFRRFILNSEGFPIDSIYTETSQTLTAYFRPEPRISLSWQLANNSRLKMAYSRNYQTVHMVPLTTSTLPLDLWLPSTDLIKPQQSDSYSLGWFSDLPDQRIEVSVEGFCRDLDHLVDFSEYQTLIGLVKNNMDQQMSFGSGNAYGIEFFIRKNSGIYQGWIGYTLSKTRYLFPDINNGEPFAPRHDRLHDLNIFITRKFSKKWEASVQFIYATGQPATIPISFYVLNGNVVQYYNDRNSIRMPAYHRLDLALTRLPQRGRKFQSSWTFSVYNLYNRLNPFFIYYDLSWDYEKNLLLATGRKIGLLPVLPSLTWTLRF